MKSGDLVRIKSGTHISVPFLLIHNFRRVRAESDGIFTTHVRAVTLLGRVGIVLRESSYNNLTTYRNGSYNVAFGEDIIVSHKSYLEKITKD